VRRGGTTVPDPAAPPGPDDPLWDAGGPARPEPARSGRGIFLLGILLTLIGLLTRNLWLALLGFGALSGPIVGSLLRPRLDRLEVELAPASRATVGEPARLLVQVHNRGRASLPPIVLTCRSDGFEPVRLRVPPLAPGHGGRLDSEQLPARRGESATAWVRIESRAPFGLTRRHQVVRCRPAEPVLVHPRRMPPERLDQLGGEGERPSGVRDRDGSQPWSMRDYRPGDPVRLVHWRSSARRGELVVVEPERTVAERVAVLAVGASPDPAWEEALARAAWTVADLLARGGEVTLATAGSAGATGDPAAALDWFARLPAALPPDAEDLAERLRATGGGDVLVLAPATVPPGWWVMAQSVAAATGCRLLRAGP
jgi:uncharacterized protein (DUF58 family)